MSASLLPFFGGEYETETKGLPGDNDDLVHDGHLLHHRRHVAEDLLGQGDDVGVLLGREGLGLGVIAVDGDAEVVARGTGGAPHVRRIDGYGNLGLRHDVALGADRGYGEGAPGDGWDGFEDGGAGGVGEKGSRGPGDA